MPFFFSPFKGAGGVFIKKRGKNLEVYKNIRIFAPQKQAD